MHRRGRSVAAWLLIGQMVLVGSQGLLAAEPRHPTLDKVDREALAAIKEYVAARVKDQRWLAANLGALKGLRKLEEKVLAETLPKFRLYLLRTMTYPIARMVPGPLASRNIFAVGPEAAEGFAITHVTRPAGLWAFCEKSLRATDAKAARAAAHAYAVLRKELAQDGFYRFDVRPDKFQVNAKSGNIVVKGSVTVAAPAARPGPGPRLRPMGNSGSIDFAAAFQGREGVFKLVVEKSSLRAGMRPICQSLRLTDPDPAVRARAQHDLLWMGTNALPYLRMQSAKTTGGLRRAILDLARRIEAGEQVEGGQPPAN